MTVDDAEMNNHLTEQLEALVERLSEAASVAFEDGDQSTASFNRIQAEGVKEAISLLKQSAAGFAPKGLEGEFHDLMLDALGRSEIEDDKAARRAAAEDAYGEMVDRLSDLLAKAAA